MAQCLSGLRGFSTQNPQKDKARSFLYEKRLSVMIIKKRRTGVRRFHAIIKANYSISIVLLLNGAKAGVIGALENFRNLVVVDIFNGAQNVTGRRTETSDTFCRVTLAVDRFHPGDQVDT